VPPPAYPEARMNTSTTGALLAHDKIDRFRSFGAFGKPAYQSHVQLRAMLKAKRGDKFANYFAKPTVDPDAGELRWTAEVPGAARGWHEMSPEEQGQRALDLEVIRSGLMGFAQELRAQGGGQPGGAAAFASLLEQAMKVPAQGNFLYFVGEQPVIAFWGFEDPTGTSVDPAVQAPRLAASPAVAEVPVPPPVVVPVEPVKKRRPWWWWLLWLLLALLLLLLLLLLPRACTPTGGFDLKRAIPGLTPPDDAASDPERRADMGGPGGGAGPGAAGGPGGAPDAGGMPPGGGNPPGVDPALPGASQPDAGGVDPSAPPKPDMPPPDAKDPNKPETPPDPKQDPLTNPPKPDPNDPNAKPDKDGKLPNDKGSTNPPMPPVDPKAMKVPDDPNAAKKMDFLEGGWKAGEGLVDKKTQTPLDLSFKFGKDGKGEVTLKRADGSTCSGTVQGKMNGGKLGIDGNQAIPCSGGGSYGAPKIECAKERDGQTQCYGVNPDGSRYSMGMQRQ